MKVSLLLWFLIALQQIFHGLSCTFIIFGLGVLLVTFVAIFDRERHGRYLEAVVMMQVFERDHPDEFNEIKKERYELEDESKKSCRFFERTN